MEITLPSCIVYNQVSISDLYNGIKYKATRDQFQDTLAENNKKQLLKIYKKLKFRVICMGAKLRATIPDNWSVTNLNNNDNSSGPTRCLVDEHKRVRAFIYDNGTIPNHLKENTHDIIPKIEFVNRFSISVDRESVEVYINNMSNIIKVFDKHDLAKLKIKHTYSKTAELKRMAITYLNTNYPNWEDVTLYWD